MDKKTEVVLFGDKYSVLGGELTITQFLNRNVKREIWTDPVEWEKTVNVSEITDKDMLVTVFSDDTSNGKYSERKSLAYLEPLMKPFCGDSECMKDGDILASQVSGLTYDGNEIVLNLSHCENTYYGFAPKRERYPRPSLENVIQGDNWEVAYLSEKMLGKILVIGKHYPNDPKCIITLQVKGSDKDMYAISNELTIKSMSFDSMSFASHELKENGRFYSNDRSRDLTDICLTTGADCDDQILDDFVFWAECQIESLIDRIRIGACWPERVPDPV